MPHVPGVRGSGIGASLAFRILHDDPGASIGFLDAYGLTRIDLTELDFGGVGCLRVGGADGRIGAGQVSEPPT